jgi:hypothetical protein
MPFAVTAFTPCKSELSLVYNLLDAFRNETRNQGLVVKQLNQQSVA